MTGTEAYSYLVADPINFLMRHVLSMGWTVPATEVVPDTTQLWMYNDGQNRADAESYTISDSQNLAARDGGAKRIMQAFGVGVTQENQVSGETASGPKIHQLPAVALPRPKESPRLLLQAQLSGCTLVMQNLHRNINSGPFICHIQPNNEVHTFGPVQQDEPTGTTLENWLSWKRPKFEGSDVPTTLFGPLQCSRLVARNGTDYFCNANLVGIGRNDRWALYFQQYSALSSRILTAGRVAWLS